MDLLKKKCVPCEGGVEPFTKKQAEEYLKHVQGWVVEDNRLKKRLVFNEFLTLIKFLNDLANLAEKEGHHPDFTVHYNKLDFEIWTHAIDGLSENDFILAAKIDKLYEKYA